jgi:hypothetical protein
LKFIWMEHKKRRKCGIIWYLDFIVVKHFVQLENQLDGFECKELEWMKRLIFKWNTFWCFQEYYNVIMRHLFCWDFRFYWICLKEELGLEVGSQNLIVTLGSLSLMVNTSIIFDRKLLLSGASIFQLSYHFLPHMLILRNPTNIPHYFFKNSFIRNHFTKSSVKIIELSETLKDNNRNTSSLSI